MGRSNLFRFVYVVTILTSVGCLSKSPLRYAEHSDSTSGSISSLPSVPPPGSIPLGPNFSSLYVNVFVPKCVACHGSVNPPAGYDLSTYTAVTSGGRVIPGSPLTSPLYQRVNDNTMPPTGPLNMLERQAIYDWIAKGANNDGPAIGPISTPTPVPLVPTFTSIKANILDRRCLSCHGPTKAAEGYRVTDYASTLRKVQPFNSALSELYVEVAADRMPEDGPLSAAEKQVIKTWIDNGAPNN
jgi:hypothetical protein